MDDRDIEMELKKYVIQERNDRVKLGFEVTFRIILLLVVLGIILGFVGLVMLILLFVIF